MQLLSLIEHVMEPQNDSDYMFRRKISDIKMVRSYPDEEYKILTNEG